MASVPKIFISATSKDLQSTREVLKRIADLMDWKVVEQSHFPADFGTLKDSLQKRIKECDAVEAVVGFVYGSGPNDGAEPRSYTQWEFEFALQLKKPVIIFLCSPDYPFDCELEAEPPDKRALQLQHRERIESTDLVRIPLSDKEMLREKLPTLELFLREARAQSRKRGCKIQFAISLTFAVVLAGLLTFSLEFLPTPGSVAQRSIPIPEPGPADNTSYSKLNPYKLGAGHAQIDDQERLGWSPVASSFDGVHLTPGIEGLDHLLADLTLSYASSTRVTLSQVIIIRKQKNQTLEARAASIIPITLQKSEPQRFSIMIKGARHEFDPLQPKARESDLIFILAGKDESNELALVPFDLHQTKTLTILDRKLLRAFALYQLREENRK